LWVESEFGRGSTFTVLLPTLEPPGASAGGTGGLPAQTRDPILIVDDSPDQCRLVEQWLKRGRYTSVSVGSGEEALRWLETNRASLVLLDIRLPGVSGYEVLKRLNENPRLADTPVLLMTAQALGAEATATQGTTGLLQKATLNGTALLEQVQMVLREGS
jgi:CheY-like chemotaxis protein